jgi:predicted amidophosphoribosyltransferase
VSRREFGAARLNPADGGPPLPVWCSAWYTGTVRRAIVAWKRAGRGELEREMARAVARTAEVAARVLGEVTDTVAVVPIPSRLARRWSRPVRGTEALALAAAEGLSGAGLGAEYADVLTRAPWAKEQAGLSSRQRQAGREDTTRLRRSATRGPDAWRRLWAEAPTSESLAQGSRLQLPSLLVDDVLTTGATLLDAERALARAGRQTLGAVVLAASPAETGTLADGPGRA